MLTFVLHLFLTQPELVNPSALEPKLRFDIKYASTDNFTHTVLYPCARCLLRPDVAQMLLTAQANLDKELPGFSLLLKDCYRPESIQRKMWNVVKGTSSQAYVADPDSKTGSVHNYGAAVDLTLADNTGREVDMGTPYDSFTKLAQPRHEEHMLKNGSLSAQHLRYRQTLRRVMQNAGFKSIRNEWWHFDAWQGQSLTARYAKLDLPLCD